MPDGLDPLPAGRYPAHLIDVVRLRDRRVTVRPVLPQDAALQQAFVRRLSVESRYHRFLSPIRELSPAMLDSLMRVDHRTHLALIAEVFEGEDEIAVGEARYVVDGVGDAEFALAVADDWQGAGLGRLLLRKLEGAAASAGLRRMVGDTLRANRPMLRLAQAAGFAIKPGAGTAWTVRLEKIIDGRLPLAA